MNKFILSKTATVVALASILGLQSASAIVTFNLLAPVANGVGVVADGGKNVVVNLGTSTVLLDLWIVVTGADATGTNEGLLSTLGGMILSGGPPINVGGITLDAGIPGNTAILSVSTTLRGNLRNPGVTTNGDTQGLISPWNSAPTSNGGVSRDLNGDGFMDIGGSSSTSVSGGFISPHGGIIRNSASGLTPVVNFNLLPDGVEFRVAQYNFDIPNAQPGTSTGVNYAEALFSTLGNASRAAWSRDGSSLQSGATANLAVGGVVNITVVPEPSALGILAFGSLILVGFRRLSPRRPA